MDPAESEKVKRKWNIGGEVCGWWFSILPIGC